METGKVWLVGAGPSDEGLLTLRGKEIIEQAQVVVYDALVGLPVLSYIPEQAQVIYAGKRAGAHTLSQEKINELLVREAQKGKRVVRLKGGDPFLFGRGGEELEELLKAGIPYEVVPGVPSAVSVPAYCGIPVTHRDFCSSLHIITGHKKKGEALNIDFQALKQSGGTYVFLMGVMALGDICRGFLEAGMPGDTPAALLSRGTTACQKKVIATLDTIDERRKQEKIPTPAIIVIGEVCALAGQFAWHEKLPLHGVRAIVTRPRERSKRLAGMLRNLGAEVVQVPAIRTLPRENVRFGDLESYQWIVFTSPAGVRIFFDLCREQRMDIRRLAGSRIAAIGEGTAKELQERGFLVDLMPDVYDGISLGKLLGETVKDGDHLLIPRAGMGSAQLVEEILTRKRVQVTDLPIYDTVLESPSCIDVKALFEQEEGCGRTIAVFTSSSTVRGFEQITAGLDYSRIQAACIGRQTAETAAALGMKTETAQKATVESLVELIVEKYGNLA